MNDELMHMLGYITTSQWKDALTNWETLQKSVLWGLIKEVDDHYDMGLQDEIEELINEE